MISLIIPVREDRAIERTLEALGSLPKPTRVEVLVIDASEGGLDDIKRRFANEKRFSLRWIRFRNTNGKKYTFSEQVNVGLRNAKGDPIGFIDADCIPDKRWLIELYKPFAQGEKFVTGLVRASGGANTYDAYWEAIPDGSYRDEAGSANSLFRREVLKRVGYYDEQFAAGSDIDFSWRAIDEGYRPYYAKRAIMLDDWGTFRQELARAVRYGVARVKLYRKHAARRRDLLGREWTLLFYPLYILFLPVALFWPYYFLFILVPLVKNIGRSPLRFTTLNFVYGWGVLREIIAGSLRRDAS